MDAMRARLLAAMGLGSLAGCPRAQEPVSPPPVVEAGVAAPTTAATEAPDARSEETIDATPLANDASTIAVADAAPKKKPAPPKIAPLPASAWYVTFPLAKPTADWCKNGSAVCVPLEWAAKTNGTPGQPTCPTEIAEECRCPAGSSCNEDLVGLGVCPDTYHHAITQKQRAGGKKDACCYAQPVMCTPPWVGRVLRDEDESVVRCAPERRDDWLGEGVSYDDELTEPERLAVAAHWIDVASGEHASVASFAHASLELMAHGAPAELLEATHRAALDEIEHARLAYALASAYARTPIGPRPLATTRPLARSLVELSLSTLRDACVPEAIGALLAAEVARTAAMPAVREAMYRIAEDEARHAELAFRVLAWTVRAGGEDVMVALRDALADAQPPLPASGSALPAHGLLGHEVERAIVERAMSCVVLPCVKALLSEPTNRKHVPRDLESSAANSGPPAETGGPPAAAAS